MSTEAFLNWLKGQYTVTIVQEAGHVRIGTLAPDRGLLHMQWTVAPTIEDAIKAKIGLDKAE